MHDHKDTAFLRRLLPLPRKVDIDWNFTTCVSMNRIAFRFPSLSRPDLRADWILETLGAFASNLETRISTPDDIFLLDFHLEDTADLPDTPEAYRISPTIDADLVTGLKISAREIGGLVPATYTLRQLLLVPTVPPPGSGQSKNLGTDNPDTKASSSITIPAVSIIDYPSISERGQWGGNTHDEVPWTAQWKMNLVEESAGIGYTDSALRLSLKQAHIDSAYARGVNIVPYVPHLEQIAKHAGFLDRRDVTSTPDPDRPLPPEYVPGLCMSSPATLELIRIWLKALAEYEHVRSIEVWLSEGPAPCYCANCSGTDPFVLEMRCIQKAFETVRSAHPSVKLRILLTQGSYRVNDLVLDEAGANVEIVYYDGGRTYDSSHTPMIYPLLEEYSRRGGWLGVYPQITHCWRTVFPFTGPQLIAARAREFSAKRLENVVGYAVPSNRHHAFNVAALAEWSWNHEGRSPEEFAATYATIHGFPEPDAFAAWSIAAGDAGWWLAESRLLLRLCYDYRFFEKPISTENDHRFEFAGFKYDRDTIEKALETARRSIELSTRTGLDWTYFESRALTAGLEALLCVDDVVSLLVTETTLRDEALGEAVDVLDALDQASADVSHYVSEWGEQISRELYGDAPYSCMMRMRDTANVLLRFCDAVRGHSLFTPVTDTSERYREVRLDEWSRTNFDETRTAEYEFDVTSAATSQPGIYYLCLTYTGGNCGGTAACLEVIEISGDGERRTITESIDAISYIGKYESWHDAKIEIPNPRPDASYMLRFVLGVEILETTDISTWEFTGRIGLRGAMPPSS